MISDAGSTHVQSHDSLLGSCDPPTAIGIVIARTRLPGRVLAVGLGAASPASVLSLVNRGRGYAQSLLKVSGGEER